MGKPQPPQGQGQAEARPGQAINPWLGTSSNQAHGRAGWGEARALVQPQAGQSGALGCGMAREHSHKTVKTDQMYQIA